MGRILNKPFLLKRSEPKKYCTKCNELKKYSGFYMRSASPDGKQSICKECMKKYKKNKKS